MRYSNPPLAAQSLPQNEVREFLVLLGAVAGIVALLLSIAVVLGGAIAPLIPFSAERSMAANVEQRLAGSGVETPGHAQIRERLAALVERVSLVMELGPEMDITVHYVDSHTVNAMATLGGHLFVFRGLLEKVENEEELAAVIAHEIGHVRARHVIRAMGRGVAVVAALAAVGVKSQGLSSWVMGRSGELTALTFSREAEREADRAALDASYRLYGHVGGVVQLFEFFTRNSEGGLEILKTHPLPENRLAEMRSLAQSQGYPLTGPLHPLAPLDPQDASDPVPPQTQ